MIFLHQGDIARGGGVGSGGDGGELMVTEVVDDLSLLSVAEPPAANAQPKKFKKVIFLYNNNKYQLAKNACILSTTVKILEQIYNFFSK